MRAPTTRVAGALLVCLLAFGLGACGGDEKDRSDSRSTGQARQGKAVEKAFLTGMVHHHESAIEMAEIAQTKGKDRFVKELADAIATTQKAEITRMEAIHERLFGAELKPDARAHDGLGLTAEEAGMTHDRTATAALRAAEPFDRAFVDEMAPHHSGAIRMSNVVLKRSNDRELRALARTIVTTQKQEIERMNSFRREEFGGPVPRDGGHGAHETMDGH